MIILVGHSQYLDIIALYRSRSDGFGGHPVLLVARCESGPEPGQLLQVLVLARPTRTVLTGGGVRPVYRGGGHPSKSVAKMNRVWTKY